MTHKKIDTSKAKPELDFNQIQNDLAKFKNHTHPIEQVKERFKSIDDGHIEYIIECLDKNHNRNP